MNWTAVLGALTEQDDLDAGVAHDAMADILAGDATSAQIAAFAIALRRDSCGGHPMALFPYAEPNPGGALVAMPEMAPRDNGTLIYLNGGDDLSNVLKRIPAAGGKVVMEKTCIGEEIGHIALFIDSEGKLTDDVLASLRQFPAVLVLPLILVQVAAGLFRFWEWNYYMGVIGARDKMSLLDSAVIFVTGFVMVVSPGKAANWCRNAVSVWSA